VRPILPVYLPLIDELQISLVHQGGRLQRVSAFVFKLLSSLAYLAGILTFSVAFMVFAPADTNSLWEGI